MFLYIPLLKLLVIYIFVVSSQDSGISGNFLCLICGLDHSGSRLFNYIIVTVSEKTDHLAPM